MKAECGPVREPGPGSGALHADCCSEGGLLQLSYLPLIPRHISQGLHGGKVIEGAKGIDGGLQENGCFRR